MYLLFMLILLSRVGLNAAPISTSRPAMMLQKPASELWRDTSDSRFACGPAVMAVALTAFDLNVNNEELVALPDEEGETTFAALSQYASSKGLHAVGADLSPEDLGSLNYVMILQTDVGGPETRMHFVLTGGPAGRRAVWLFDPAGIFRTRGPVPIVDLAEHWTGKALILSRTPIHINHSSLGGAVTRRINYVFLLCGCATIVTASCLVFRKPLRSRRKACTLPNAAILCVIASIAPIRANPPSATQSAPSLSAGRRFVIGSSRHSAGAVSLGTMIQHEFRLKNPTSHSLQIAIRHTSCACTEATIIGRSVIAPGEESGVRLEVHAYRAGALLHGALISVSGEDEDLELSISAEVEDDTVLMPEHMLEFGTVSRDEPVPAKRIEIEHLTRGDDFEVVSCTASAGYVTVVHAAETGTRPFDMDGRAVCRRAWLVSIDPSEMELGPFVETVTIHAKKGENRLRFRVLCAGRVRSDVVSIPSRIAIMEPEFRNSISIELRLEAEHSGLPVIASIEGDNVTLGGWQQTSTIDGRASLVTIELIGLRPEPRTVGACHIKLSHTKEEVVVPILIIRKQAASLAVVATGVSSSPAE